MQIKKYLKIGLIVLVIFFAILQFFRPDRTNPQIVETETLEASTEVPENVREVIARSCNDCHTNKTVYPWYSNISPISWHLAGDIADGRRQMNFSIWNTYETKRKIRKLDEICEQLESKAMPLPSYLWLHRDAMLTAEDSGILCGWARTERDRLSQ